MEPEQIKVLQTVLFVADAMFQRTGRAIRHSNSRHNRHNRQPQPQVKSSHWCNGRTYGIPTSIDVELGNVWLHPCLRTTLVTFLAKTGSSWAAIGRRWKASGYLCYDVNGLTQSLFMTWTVNLRGSKVAFLQREFSRSQLPFSVFSITHTSKPVIFVS